MATEYADFHYRGHIEVPNGKGSYRWTNGYSQTSPDGHVLYPWMRMRDCYSSAASEGKKARFFYNGSRIK